MQLKSVLLFVSSKIALIQLVLFYCYLSSGSTAVDLSRASSSASITLKNTDTTSIARSKLSANKLTISKEVIHPTNSSDGETYPMELKSPNMTKLEAKKPIEKSFFRKKKRSVDPNSSAALYSKKLKNRNSLNIKRKLTHTAFGFFFAALNHFVPKSKFVPCMTLLSSATLFMELMRYKKGFGWMNDALHFVLGSSLRKHEMEGKFTGSFYYFLGVTCTSALFSKTAATLGICQLALADPAASYFGRKIRNVYWSRIDKGFFGFGRNKGILGFLGGAFVCVPFNYHVLNIAKFTCRPKPSSLLMISLALGLAGAFADLAVPSPAITLPAKICGIPVPPLHVDDNFVVPIFSAWACEKILNFFKMPFFGISACFHSVKCFSKFYNYEILKNTK